MTDDVCRVCEEKRPGDGHAGPCYARAELSERVRATDAAIDAARAVCEAAALVPHTHPAVVALLAEATADPAGRAAGVAASLEGRAGGRAAAAAAAAARALAAAVDARAAAVDAAIRGPRPAGARGGEAGRLVLPVAVALSDFSVLKTISRGAFGVIFLVRKRSTGDLYAMKAMSERMRPLAVAERDAMAVPDSPFVVRLYFSFWSAHRYYLVMDYAPGGDLMALLRSVGTLQEAAVVRYAADLVLALEHLHGHGIVHHDVKPDNLLIAADGHLRLADFGLAVRVPARAAARGRKRPREWPEYAGAGAGGGDGPGGRARAARPGGAVPGVPLTAPPECGVRGGAGDAEAVAKAAAEARARAEAEAEAEAAAAAAEVAATSAAATAAAAAACAAWGEAGGTSLRLRGSPDYLAPEVLLELEPTPAVDMWALGSVVFELLAGFPPFHAPTEQEVLRNVLALDAQWYNIDESVEVSPNAMDFVMRLLEPNPDRRLSAAEAKAHPFFDGVDWARQASAEPVFVPVVKNTTDTSYFAPRCEVFPLTDEMRSLSILRKPGSTASSPAGTKRGRRLGAPRRAITPLRVRTDTVPDPPPARAATAFALRHVRNLSLRRRVACVEALVPDR